MRIPRIYADTSVIGGCLDIEFSHESLHFIEMVRNGKCVLLLSEITIAELDKAPTAVQNILLSLPEEAMEKVEITEEILELRNEYMKAKILGPEWIDDAAHVAVATVARADAIVSWNFKHIVRLDKMKGYNQVNLMNGYGILTIISPKEVLIDED
jgi:predicted nucleic acid-binding protein